LVTRETLDGSVIVCGVHVGEQDVGIPKRPQIVDRVHPKFFEQSKHGKLTSGETPFDCCLTSSCVERAQGMISAFRSGNDSIGIGRERQKALQKSASDKWHVTRQDEDQVLGGGGECRIEAAQRPAAFDAILHEPNTFVDRHNPRELPGIRPHKDHVACDRAEGIELPVDDAPSINGQRCLGTAAESCGESTGQNGRSHVLQRSTILLVM
jgi:hypothetical protein